MDEQNIDRRVMKTRQALQEALVGLILEKGYQKITVQDIIDKANVGRSTFYDHFLDKEDLLEKSFMYLADDLSDQVMTPHQHENEVDHIVHSLDFFRHAYVNRPFYKAMAESGGGDVLLKKGSQHIKQNILAHLKLMKVDEADLPAPIEVLVHFLASSLLAMITWWVDQEADYTAEEMNAMYTALALRGLEGITSSK